MIGLIRLLVLLALAAPPVQAQVIEMRSGEHEAFTRLTLALPERADWSIIPVDGGAHVRFSDEDLSIDTGRVFERIPRDRLTDARWNAGGRTLELTFGCACEVRGFWFGASMLVLDVSAGPDPIDAGGAPVEVPPSGALPGRGVSWAASLLTPFPAEMRTGPLAPVNRVPPQGPPDAERAARDRLLRHLSRATSQGLLEPHSRGAGAAVATPATAGSAAAEQLRPPPPVPDLRANLRVNSRIDLDHLSSRSAREPARAHVACLPESVIDVASWGTGAPFSRQIAPLRLQIMEEFDRINAPKVKELVRSYLYFGFGAEARDLLRLLPEDDADLPPLLALAAVAEQGHAAPGSPLSGQLECTSVAAMWSALAHAELPRDAALDRDAIARAFSALPPHLRDYYGPILSRRLIAAADPTLASRIVRIMDRGASHPPAEGNEAEMASALVALAKGETAAATDRLQNVVGGDLPPEAAALIRRIEAQIEGDAPVSIEQAETLGSFAFEYRNEPAAPPLHAAHVRALAAAASFDSARDVYAERAGEIAPKARAQLRRDIARLLADRADDVTFLRHMLADSFDQAQQPDPAVANDLAGRLLSLGFPGRAADLIDASVPLADDTRVDRRLLRAEIALARQEPRQAQVALLDLPGERANLLRARAHALAGEHAAAQRLFTAAGASDAARVASLLAERGEADPAVPVSDAPADPAPLAARRALIETSTTTRDTLSRLLAEHPAPLPED